MNIIDIFIILFAIGALIRGYEIGFVRQLFSTVGFFGGLWLGGWLQRYFIRFADSPLEQVVITLACTLGCALILLSVGEYVGIIIKRKITQRAIRPIDGALGSGLAVVTMLVVVWLVASLINNLPGSNLDSYFRRSAVVQQMNRRLPPATDTIASLSRLINPNGFPDVFAGQEPAPARPVDLPGLGGFKTAIAADRDSIVKISGQGCGGLVEGSGFVVDNNLVATNAHVVAGIDHINVIDGNGSHTAVPIWFDPNLDLAVLRVSGLAGEPLDVDTTIQANGTPTAILGYPGGGDFEADSSVIRNEFTAVGRNIYGNGRTSRQVYEIQGRVVPGNSGGPVIDQSGDVVAMVFAESTDYANTGYALVTKQIMQEIQQAKYQNQARDTGSCAE